MSKLGSKSIALAHLVTAYIGELGSSDGSVQRCGYGNYVTHQVKKCIYLQGVSAFVCELPVRISRYRLRTPMHLDHQAYKLPKTMVCSRRCRFTPCVYHLNIVDGRSSSPALQGVHGCVAVTAIICNPHGCQRGVESRDARITHCGIVPPKNKHIKREEPSQSQSCTLRIPPYRPPDDTLAWLPGLTKYPMRLSRFGACASRSLPLIGPCRHRAIPSIDSAELKSGACCGPADPNAHLSSAIGSHPRCTGIIPLEYGPDANAS
jgi:hypothetical protein